MYNKKFVWFMASIAATGGLLFGFDTGVISGAIPFMQKDLNISDSGIEDITTFALIGAMIGALVSGYLSDRFGRKRIILAAAVIFLLGAIGCGSADGVTGLMAARIFLGIGIGVASFSTPLYLAEISPASIRGTLVSMFQLLITVGLLGAFLSDSAIADDANNSCWRNMFYVGVIPAIILLVGMFFLPESPRWLLSKGHEAEAIKILEKIEDPSIIAEEVNKMKSDIAQTKEELSITETFKQKWMFYPLMLAVLIMFFQQAVGINTVIYYGPSIFQKAGFESGEAALMAQVSVGVVNVIFTIASLFLIDRIGRRKLFFLGMTGMVVTLLMISYGFISLSDAGSNGRYLVVASMLLYIVFFAISMGPLGWLIITEVFPVKVRGVGSSIGSLANWGFNSLIVWTFYKSIKGFTNFFGGDESYGTAGVFCMFAAIALIGIIWGYFFLPETKGKKLEDIESHWKKGGSPRTL